MATLNSYHSDNKVAIFSALIFLRDKRLYILRKLYIYGNYFEGRLYPKETLFTLYFWTNVNT